VTPEHSTEPATQQCPAEPVQEVDANVGFLVNPTIRWRGQEWL